MSEPNLGSPAPPATTPHSPAPQPRRGLAVAVTLVGLAAIVVAGVFITRGAGGGPPRTPTISGPCVCPDYEVLHVAWVGTSDQQISPLDPGTASDTTNLPIVQLLFDTLVTTDQQLNPKLWGADQVSVSPDGRTYRFHIRAGQVFSDGIPVRASDYAYGITRALDPCFQSPVNYDLWMIQGAKRFSDPKNCVNHAAVLPLTAVVADDPAATLTITLQQPAAYFLAALTTPVGAALEHDAVTGPDLGKDEQWTAGLVADARHPVGQGGSGMYYVAQYDADGNLILKQNPHWWGTKPYLKEIDYTIFHDAQQAETAINASPDQYRYDVFDPGPSTIAAGSSLGDAQTVPYLAYKGITFNWRTPPFDNADARQAFCLAVNRDQLVRDLPNPTQPSWHLVPQGMPGYNTGLTGIDEVISTSGDVAKAHAHWQAYLATLHGAKPPTILFHYQSGSVSAQQFALALVGQWNAAFGAGTVVGNNYAPDTIMQPPEGSYPASLFGWLADYPDPQDFLSLLYTTFSPYNSWHASVPDADRLMQQADITRDPGTRFALYHQAEQLLVQQVAVCPLFQFTKSYRVQPYLHGYVEDALGEVPLDAWAGMYVGKH